MAETVVNRYNHSIFIDPETHLLTVMQYIKVKSDHFYKKGQFNLLEDSNRYPLTSVETDFPYLIDGYVSSKMLDQIVRDEMMYHKGEIE